MELGQQNEAFWYWKPEDRSKYLLSVLRVYGFSIGYVLIKDYANDPAHDIAVVDVASVAHASVSHVDYVAHAAPDIIIQEINQDLARLPELSAAELLTQPLWSEPAPKDWLQLLDQFKEAAKSLNAGFEVWLDWYDDRLQGKAFDAELLHHWNNLPSEYLSQGPATVNAYLKDLVDKKATRPLNQVRAIFIGYGEAGKTSLICVLNNEPVVEGDGDMTPGIDISDWPVPGSDIKAHFWDFGGQVMAHATHQFFLRERCLYVLVLNARSEIDSTEQAEYWLEHVKSFGEDARVMIVGNKADKAGLNLDMSYQKANIQALSIISRCLAPRH